MVTEPVKKPRTGLTTYNRTGELQPEDNRVESLESRMKQMEIMLESIYNSVGKGQNKNPDTQKKEAENREVMKLPQLMQRKRIVRHSVNRRLSKGRKLEKG